MPKDGPRQSLATIEEVSSTITMDTSPPGSAAPKGISEVVVTKTKVPPNTSESSLSPVQPSSSSIKTGEKPDPRSLAAKSVSALVPQNKSVTFNDNVRVNTTETASLKNTEPTDTKSVYVPNVLTARVKAFDPEVVADTSDTAISLDNDNHKDSVDFLVDYVTSYETKSEGGNTVVTSSSQDNCAVEPESNLSQYFASKTYNHALSSLEDSLKEDCGNEPLSQTQMSRPGVPSTEQSEGTSSESKSLEADSKSLDTTSYTSFSSESNQKMGITSLSSIGSVETAGTSQSESVNASVTSLNATTTQDSIIPSSISKDNTPSEHVSQVHDSHDPQSLSCQDQSSHNQSSHTQPSSIQTTQDKISQDHAPKNHISQNVSSQNHVTENNNSQNEKSHTTQNQELSLDNIPLTSDQNHTFTIQEPGPQVQGSNDRILQNQVHQKQPSQFQLSLNSIPQYQSSQNQRSSTQTSHNQPSQNQPSQNQATLKILAEGHIPQVQLSLDNINIPKSQVLQKHPYQDTNYVGRKSHGSHALKQYAPQDQISKERSRRTRQDSDEMNAARSLNDILLIESDPRFVSDV